MPTQEQRLTDAFQLIGADIKNILNALWTKTGNAGTNPATHFLGTTDAQNLVFKTNNTESFRIFATTQNIGINTLIDNGFKLNVYGNLRVNNGLLVAAPDVLTSDYITGVLKLPNIQIEAVHRNNLSQRHTIRAGGWHTSTWFGVECLQNWQNTGGSTATQNAAFGWGALRYGTTCFNNSGFGAFALSNITTGSNNTGCGYDAAWLATTAANITAVGSLALGDVTTGNNNSAFGANSGRGITTGGNNTIIGANITGLAAALSDTVIIASGAGGTGAYRIFSPSSGNILIGTTTDAGFKLDVNGAGRFRNSSDLSSLAIGNASNVNRIMPYSTGVPIRFVNASNTYANIGVAAISIGNTYADVLAPTNGAIIQGNVLIGTTTDVASSLLTINSTTKGFLPPRMTSAQRTAIASPAVGLVVYQTDATEGLYVRTSTGWTIL